MAVIVKPNLQALLSEKIVCICIQILYHNNSFCYRLYMGLLVKNYW